MARSQITIFKKSNHSGEKFDPPGNINNPYRLHAHIAYPGKEYEERENYPRVEFGSNNGK
jgi:SLT domain-containing protein